MTPCTHGPTGCQTCDVHGCEFCPECNPPAPRDPLRDTAAALTHAQTALDAAHRAHVDAVVAEVRASVPGPWVAEAEVGAVIELRSVLVGVDWMAGEWRAWASGMSPTASGLLWHRRGDAAASPREALTAFRTELNRCRSEEGREALALVVRLLRGWMTALRWTTVEGVHFLTDGHAEVARLVPVGDCWRPFVNGRRCTLADDLPAAVAIVRAVLGVDVPGVPL